MKIGKALKTIRNKLKLTQDEMSSGIVSRSFYARVEADKHEISAEKLAKILFKNEIDINEFYQLIRKDYISEEQENIEFLQKQIENAVNEQNLSKLEYYCYKIMNLNENKILKLRAIVTLAYFRKELSMINAEIRANIFEQFDEGQNWIMRPELLRLLANTMPLWSQESLDFLIKRLLSYLKKIDFNKVQELMLERYLRLMGNYLVICYDRKIYLKSKYSKNVMDKVFSFILNIKVNFHLLIYKLHSLYIKFLINDDTDKKYMIKNFLAKLGYSKVIKNWPK